MQKTKLGISVGLLAAAVFFACLFGGFTVTVIMAGYILLFEENEWLKKSAVKGVALMFGISILSTLIHFIPDAIDFVDDIFNLFESYFTIEIISKIIYIFDDIIFIAEKVLFILLGFKALKQGTINIPVIDPLINKYMG